MSARIAGQLVSVVSERLMSSSRLNDNVGGFGECRLFNLHIVADKQFHCLQMTSVINDNIDNDEIMSVENCSPTCYNLPLMKQILLDPNSVLYMYVFF
jgi:hypothetical protein